MTNVDIIQCFIDTGIAKVKIYYDNYQAFNFSAEIHIHFKMGPQLRIVIKELIK